MPNGEDLVLVFSDEFNTDGRTFYPGDDPFWEAVDLHYWGTVCSALFHLKIKLMELNRMTWNGTIQLEVSFKYLWPNALL